MATFDEFFSSFDLDENEIIKKNKKEKGIIFEGFIKWFLENDPVWSSKIDKVWLNNEKDLGVDLIFDDIEGKRWAVQSKCYSPQTYITKKSIDSFISASDDTRYQGRLLIASTDRIGNNADLTLKRNKVVRYLLEDFRNSSIDFPLSIKNLAQGKRKQIKTPRTHQEEAITAVIEGVKHSDRGQVLMACGTGKTLTALWIKERLKSKLTLVLLPSLSLLSQTLKEWNANASDPFQWICICSDKSVTKKNQTEDDWISNTSEIGVPVTSDVKEIQYFLNKKGYSKIVFSTYQSSPLIAEAQKEISIPMFDVVFADEAHRCSGRVSDAFGCVLDNQKIRAKKKLFLTATPRVLSNMIKSKAKMNDIQVSSMDDTSIFGKILYQIKFSQAIEKDLLSDYQVVVVGIDDPMIQKKILNRDLLSTDGKDTIDAERLASKIAVAKSIKDYDLHRLITFHGRVKSAKQFSEDFEKIVKLIKEKDRPEGMIKCDYVSGKMQSSERNEKIQSLKDNNNKRIILSNARCLSEGVDVPSLDAIAFIDPKSSQVDIIQAVGRAIRKSTNKSVGTIILPVYLGNTDNAEDKILASNFSDIWKIILALKSQDDSLMETIDRLRINLGSKTIKRGKEKGLEKIIFDLPERVSKDFSNSIQTLLITNTSEDWLERYGEVQNFYSEKGRYPAHNETNGNWCNVQRMSYKKGTLSQEKIQLLLELNGWVWDLLDNRWIEKYSELLDYINDNNGKFPKQDGKGYSPLCNWIANQRKSKNNDTLSPEREKLLQSIKDWEWIAFDERWLKKYNALIKYLKENHDKLPPARFPILGPFVGKMRQDYKKKILSEDKIRSLENLKGWEWDPFDARWKKNFKNLKKYLEENYFQLPQTIDETFGEWINTQRRSNKDGTIRDEHFSLLNNLKGWKWYER